MNSKGSSGGLCLFWNNNVKVELLTFSLTHIDVRIWQSGGLQWRFTGFYSHSEPLQRIHSWNLLRRLAGMANLPWVCVGDFNEIQSDSEKVGV